MAVQSFFFNPQYRSQKKLSPPLLTLGEGHIMNLSAKLTNQQMFMLVTAHTIPKYDDTKTNKHANTM